MVEELNNLQPIHILVELKPSSTSGEQQVSLKPPIALEKSAEAFHKALQTIQDVTHHIHKAITDIPLVERPAEVSIEFGIKMTLGGNVLVANANTEAQINVTLKWVSENGKQEQQVKPD